MRREFDLNPHLIYLNSGTLSICPRVVMEAVWRYEQQIEKNPTQELFDAWERLWKVQAQLADFLRANPADLFLRPNITSALNDFILGIPILGSGEILVSDLEYGAIVNVCRFRAEHLEKGALKVRTFQLPSRRSEFAGIGERDLVDRVVREIGPETRIVLLSHVMTANGLLMPIREIARETRARGVILVVDGAHAPGAVELDFLQLGDLDFYGGNLHKWMMGPKGSAFGWVAPRHQESLRPLQAGWTTFEIYETFKGFAKSLFQGRMLLSASSSFAPFFAISETVEFWKKHSPEKIRSRLRELQIHTDREVERFLGWEPLSPPVGPFLGPLLSYELPSEIEKQGRAFMSKMLKEHRLQISMTPIQNRFCLRLSPQIYNDEEEITKGIQILKTLKY